MKKLAIFFITFLFAFSVVNSQTAMTEKYKAKEPKKEIRSTKVPLKKLEGTGVSVKAKNQLAIDFPKAENISWERTATFDQASFTMNGQQMKAYFDSEANLVGSTIDKSFSDLPAKGQKEINEKYKDYKAGPVIFFDDNERTDTDMVLWATQFDDEDMYFAELNKGTAKIIVKITPSGEVSLFKELK